MTKDMRTAALIALIFAAAILVLNWGSWKIDMTAIYYAARSWSEGLRDLVYAPGPETFLIEPPAQWDAWARAEGWEEPFFTPFIYPPLWAAVFAPIAAAVSAKAFFNAALLASVAASIWMVWLTWRLVRPQHMGAVAWAGLSFALIFASSVGYMSFWLGQAQIIVGAVTLAAIVAMANGRDLTAGGLLALAAAAKLSPALLVILFVMEKRWRALGAFALVGGALGLLSLILAGWPLHAEMLAKLSLIEERVLLSRILVSLELVLYQIGELLSGRVDWVIEHPHQYLEAVWITWVVRATMIAGIAAVYWLTRDVTERLRIWSRFVALLLVTLITNPLGWMHYLFLPLAFLPALFEILPKRQATIAVASIGVLLSMPVFYVIADQNWGDWAQIVLNLGLTTWLLVLVLIGAKAEANPTRR